MTRLRGTLASAVAIAVIAWCGCARLPTQQAGGSGSETVFGKALMPGGSPAAKAIVRVRPTGYLSPLSVLPANNPVQYVDAVTDDSGRFSVSVNDTGLNCLEINNNAGFAMLLRLTVNGTSDSVDIGLATLEKTATVMGMARDAAGGAAQIFGLERLASIDSVSGAFSFSDLPAGTYTFRLVPKKNPGSVFSISSVKLDAGDVQNVSLMSGWKSSKRLYLNTTVTGANVAGTVTNFPVLIRLTLNNFDFTQAQASGNDLRFTKSDNMPLPYEIERWDAANNLAEVWVKADSVYGNDSTHFITMYWGNLNASGQSNGTAVFDTANGFQGVWHLAEAGNTIATDATINDYNGTPFGMTATSSVSGAIGMAQKFDGSSSYIQMTSTAVGKLNFNENDFYSISAWVLADTLDFATDSSASRHDLTIVAKDNYQYSLKCFRTDFAFIQYKNAIGWESSISPAIVAIWKYVVGVCAGTRQYLYVDGICMADSVNFLETSSRARSTASDVTIGKTPPGTNNWSPYFFKGKIDEVRICDKALSADWIKLCYMNQRFDDKLIVVK